MSFLQRVLEALGLVRRGVRLAPLKADLAETIQFLAEQEQRPEAEVSAELASQAMARYTATADLRARWGLLSKREQQAALMIQSGYTTQEMVDEMQVSPNTVKAHIASAMRKFDVHSRGELRAYMDAINPPRR
jgi:DNA-binding CsgD family transcriptional regulator